MERKKELRRLSELMAKAAMWGSRMGEKAAKVALLCSQTQMMELVSDEYDEFLGLAKRLHNLVNRTITTNTLFVEG